MTETPKKTFGKYEAISHLGSGAMGVVWRAQDPVLGRVVAIKTISAALGSDNENKERFLREARAAAQLNHPNIITVFDFGQAENELYMAMELLEGKDLKDLIVAGQLTFEQKLDIMEQVTDGLAYAHGRDVIHRDLKPGNIHVQPNGQVKILDFGLARLGSSELTKTGVVMGTPNYMSPEQVMGERVDARSDVFSAGGVFYELLTNHKPFDAESVHATLYQVVHREPPPPRQWDPRLPDALATIIETAMMKQLDGRYRSAAALRDAIRAFRNGEEPEVVEFDENFQENSAQAGSGDATAVQNLPSPSSLSGTQKAGTFKSFTRSGSGPVAEASEATSAPYTTGRMARSAAKASTRPPGAPALPSASASIPPPPAASPNPVLLAVGVLLVVVVVFIGWVVLNRQNQPVDTTTKVIMQLLIETKLDLARRVLENKDYKGAIDQAGGILNLPEQGGNPEALGIRESAQAALREIETQVGMVRDAVKRGDTTQAAAALERVLLKDPKNPIAAEVGSQLNANFAQRATSAKAEMDKARSSAEAKDGASRDAAFAEGEKLAATASESLKAREFTGATTTFLQARDAFDRARRSIEGIEAAAALEARKKAAEAAANAKATQLPTTAPTVVSTPIPQPTVLPTVVLRTITPTPLPATPAPTVVVPTPPPAVIQTPPPPPPVTGPVPELRQFVTARTRFTAAPSAAASKAPKGFDTGSMVVQDFTGKFDFEVLPAPLIPGSPFRVRILLQNEGKNEGKFESLIVKILRNGEVSTPPARLSEGSVKVGKQEQISEVSGTWVTGTATWVMDVTVVSKKGETFRSSLTMKPF